MTIPGPRLTRLAARARNERGQVTILFMFLTIAFVLVIGFLLNTARQTSRKVEMQGAADAAAMGGAVWMARGMNVMVLNNKGMADVLGVMIAVRATKQTAEAMPKILTPIIAGLYASVYGIPLAKLLAKDLVYYGNVARGLSSLDSTLSDPSSGLGWTLMRQLDRLNQVVKEGVPAVAIGDSTRFARLNGADIAPLLAGGPRPVPSLPVARGAEGALADQARDCTLDEARVADTAKGTLLAACFLFSTPCPSGPLAWPVFDFFIEQNVQSLRGSASTEHGWISSEQAGRMRDHNGDTLQDLIDRQNQNRSSNDKSKPIDIEDIFEGIAFGQAGGMSWPQDPPRPMILTDQDLPAGDARVPDALAAVDLREVRRALQLLAAAVGESKRDPFVGKNWFVNPQPYAWLTYAQADVYNPTNWNMFEQHWNARLARATLLDEKWKRVLEAIGAPEGTSDVFDLSLVNTH